MTQINIAYVLTKAAVEYREKNAIWHGSQAYTYEWWDRKASQCANAIMRMRKVHGWGRSERVGLVVENEPGALVALMGALRAGSTIVPINPTLQGDVIGEILENANISLVIGSMDHREKLEGIAEGRDWHTVIIDVHAREVEGRTGLWEWIDKEESECEDAEVEAEGVAWLFYTSGTTGVAKGAMLTHRNLWAMVYAQLMDCNPVVASDKLAYMTPIAHSNGLMLFQHVLKGAGHVLLSRGGFKARTFYNAVEKYGVTTAFMVPTMVQRLVNDVEPVGGRLKTLHTILYGGAPMYREYIEKALAKFGAIFVQGYAQGEAPMGCTWLSKDQHWKAYKGKLKELGSVGRACSNVQIQVRSEGRICGKMERGEITVRGDVVMRGYWRNERATEDILKEGWLYTGDVGYMDEDGFIYITDRIKDMVITGGLNVYPREVEEVIYRWPDVDEACVFGVEDREWGEKVIAAVVFKEGGEVRDLNRWCNENLAKYKRPKEIWVVDELPKSGYRKILKRETRDLYMEYVGSDNVRR